MFKAPIFAILLLSLSHASSFANAPCQHKDLTLSETAECLSESLRYILNDGPGKTGTLLAVQENSNTEYYLIKADGELLSLGAFAQNSRSAMQRCVFDALAFDPLLSGGTSSYGLNHFGERNFMLDGDRLYSVYAPRYPFTGSVKTADGVNCEGDAGYQPDVLTWKQGADACKAFHAKETGSTAFTLTESRMYYHVAGFYYLCEITQQDNDQPMHYFYRVDMETFAEPGLVLMRKATPAQRSLWSFRRYAN